MIGKNECQKVAFNNAPSLHAEIGKVLKILKYMRRKHIRVNKKDHFTMISAKMSQSGSWQNARPCCNCITTMLKLPINIKYVIYSTPEGWKRELLSDMLDSDKTVVSYGNRNKNK